MKEIKIIEAHIEKKEYVDRKICDICKEPIRNGSWENSEVKLEATIGEVYPETDCRNLYIIDVCQNCFLDKLKPAIEEKFNLKFREIDNEERYRLHE